MTTTIQCNEKIDIKIECSIEYLDLIRFLCETWSEIDKWAHETCSGKQLMSYPVVQGTANQAKLQKIGNQIYSIKNIRVAVDKLLELSNDQD